MIQRLVILKIEMVRKQGYIEIGFTDGESLEDYPQEIEFLGVLFIKRGQSAARNIIYYST